jgi:hypothetical protein
VDAHYEKEGVPLSPWEAGQAWAKDGGKDVAVVVGPERKRVERTNKGCVTGRHESSVYFWTMQRWDADPFTPFGSWKPRLGLALLGQVHEEGAGPRPCPCQDRHADAGL